MPMSSYFLERKLILPFFNLEEMMAAVHEEMKARKKEASKKPAAAAKEGEASELSGQERQHLKIMEDFLGLEGWLSLFTRRGLYGAAALRSGRINKGPKLLAGHSPPSGLSVSW